MIRVYDEFAGVGGTSHGASYIPGVEIYAAANHDKHAVDSHTLNFPGARHFQADITKLPVDKMPYAELFSASPACFAAGTLVLTRRGLVPIEDVVIGDEVFTHRRRWRPVVDRMERRSETIVVKGVGLAGGVETTEEHPFYTRKRVTAWDNAARRYVWQLADASDWTKAGHLSADEAWATPVGFGAATEDVPPVPGRALTLSPAFFWMVGRWLGDGTVRLQPKRGDGLGRLPTPTAQPPGSACVICGEPARNRVRGEGVLSTLYCSDKCTGRGKRRNPLRGRYELSICCGRHESADLQAALELVAPRPEEGVRSGENELVWRKRVGRTTDLYNVAHRGLVEWIVEHFGRHSHGKTVPAWALTMPEAWRRALLDGYLAADGCTRGAYTGYTTISKRLALGMRMLANSLGEHACMQAPATRKPGRHIEGRPVNERPTYNVTWITGGPRSLYTREAEGFRWGPIKKIETGSVKAVYDITVDEDHSYLADGIVVHNCPAWTTANGVRREFDRANVEVQTLFDVAEDEDPRLAKRREEYRRSRLLMREVPRYLRAMSERGRPVLAGMMENVIQCRQWHEWDDWFAEIVKLGYEIRIIAFNSMHAEPVRSLKAPQSRDRLYLAYWHRSLGRRPDFDKWLRPHAYCPSCDERVQAVQVWKKPGVDMGRYQSQYVYQCPQVSCRGRQVHPETLPALAAIDPTVPGLRIGDRAQRKLPLLAEATLDRIRAGIRRYWAPLMVPVEGRPGKVASPAAASMRTQTCRNETGYALPPFLAPAGGTWRDTPSSGLEPMPTRTTRECDGVATLPMFPPFITPLRGGGDKENARSVSDPLTTVTASGNHHGLALPPLITRQNSGHPQSRTTPATEPVRTLTAEGSQSVSFASSLLVPYYGSSDSALPATSPVGTLTTRDRYGIATPDLDAIAAGFDVDDVLFRMLEPHEIARAMAFDPSYQTSVQDKRTKVKLFGNAVTAPVAEVIMSALVECITGESLDRSASARELAVAA